MRFGNLKATLESNQTDAVEGADIDNDTNPETQEHNALGEDQITGDDQSAELQENVEEIQSTGLALQGQGEEVDKSFTAAQSLDQIQAEAQNQADTEGAITPASATIMQTTMESIMQRLGLKSKELPTIEAYKGKFSKEAATRLTLESFGDTVKQGWDKLIEMLKSLWNSTLNFLTRIFENRTLLENRLKSLRAKIKGIDFDAEKKSETVKGPFVTALAFRGESSSDTAWAILNTARGLLAGYDMGVKSIDGIRDRTFPADNSNIEVLQHFISRVFQGELNFKVRDGSEDTQLYGAMPKGMSLELGSATAQSAISFHTNRGKVLNLPTEMDALDYRDIFTMLDSGLALLRDLKALETKTSTLTNAVGGIIRKLQTEYHTLRGAMGNGDHEAKALAQRNAREAQAVLSKVIARFPSVIFMSVKHTADYCEASIRNFQPKVA